MKEDSCEIHRSQVLWVRRFGKLVQCRSSQSVKDILFSLNKRCLNILAASSQSGISENHNSYEERLKWVELHFKFLHWLVDLGDLLRGASASSYRIQRVRTCWSVRNRDYVLELIILTDVSVVSTLTTNNIGWHITDRRYSLRFVCV